MTQKLILIGAGMAGMRFLEHLLEEAPGQYVIEVFNKEPVGGYNRILLSPVLAGEKQLADIMTHEKAWFAERGVHLHIGKTISDIDLQGKRLTTFCGETHFYDKLVIATGSEPFILPIPGNELQGVVSFREIRDVEKMISIAESGKEVPRRAVVIGGGLLGLEAAYGLLKRGMSVTVVHRSDVLMNMQMDAEAGSMLQKHLMSGWNGGPGMEFRMGVNTIEIAGAERVEAVRFDDGSEIPADLVVMAVGIRPNVKQGTQAGLEVNRGIVVDDRLQTSAPDVYALGECCEHRGETYGLVAPLYEQAAVLSKVLTGKAADYRGSTTSTMLKVTGVELFSAGDFKGDNFSESLIYRDIAQGIYRKVVLKNNRVIGVLLFGDTSDANWLFDLLKQQNDISSIRDTLVFGQGFPQAS